MCKSARVQECKGMTLGEWEPATDVGVRRVKRNGGGEEEEVIIN